jgi:hypothetical protein
MFRRVGIGSLDLDETLGANRLIAASGSIQIRWIVEKADGTFGRVFVETGFQRLPIHQRIIG